MTIKQTKTGYKATQGNVVASGKTRQEAFDKAVKAIWRK